MDNFIAIDVETANNQPTSICAIGAVLVIDGIIKSTFYELVRPEPNWYIRYFSTSIHGIYPNDTENCSGFSLCGVVWPTLLPYMEPIWKQFRLWPTIRVLMRNVSVHVIAFIQ